MTAQSRGVAQKFGGMIPRIGVKVRNFGEVIAQLEE
jgi:hypothetical protein